MGEHSLGEGEGDFLGDWAKGDDFLGDPALGDFGRGDGRFGRLGFRPPPPLRQL
ncbi:MAG TPA: hypothetical protein VEL76_30135 [Gemmataceae bacterium]|nr:hypothetical protein [Gemmataceae bacterium]